MRTVPRRGAVIGGMDIEGADIAHPARDVVMKEMPKHSQGDNNDKHRQNERRGMARAQDASTLNHAGNLPQDASSFVPAAWSPSHLGRKPVPRPEAVRAKRLARAPGQRPRRLHRAARARPAVEIALEIALRLTAM